MTTHPKPSRKKDPALLKRVRAQPCLACLSQAYPTEADHITTRGAGGGDTADNVWPLCTFHHRMRHQKGLSHMVRVFPGCARWLGDHRRMDVIESVAGLKSGSQPHAENRVSTALNTAETVDLAADKG